MPKLSIPPTAKLPVAANVAPPDPYALAQQAAKQIHARGGVESVDMVLVLGSGWAHGADRLGELRTRLPIGSLPGFSAPVVAGHGGEALITELASGKAALVLTGRTHLYEGKGVAAVVHGIRTAAALGATTLVVTNGCGGLDWGPGIGRRRLPAGLGRPRGRSRANGGYRRWTCR